ncbi:hypothetical protein KC19_9G056400 [Ceratodon purpureus]|uniref:Uncharacterized protein n=1 Tax=Ceratodon purpureus TaxID=3225 RepID=A0A8T0GSD5_CERPU|nr:hypothetical protein KC19_9G056400 [Ceratodon purpureus]
MLILQALVMTTDGPQDQAVGLLFHIKIPRWIGMPSRDDTYNEKLVFERCSAVECICYLYPSHEYVYLVKLVVFFIFCRMMCTRLNMRKQPGSGWRWGFGAAS